MERLMVVTTFQKSIDSLKTTECSQKEKLALFTQISDCIQAPALRGNANYLMFVSNAVSILLMFCEDIDSVIRMSAEENLNRIIRFSTPLNVVRIQYDLFQEIKRNGNDRSLRIALNTFAHYAHTIKQRKIKPYALNLLPCILSISQRKEQQLIETLSSFLVKFCKYFQISLTENEVSNLIEYFLKDAINTECSVKRRCSASNVITLIEHSRRPDVMSKHALTLCLDNLVKDFTLNTIVGALGLLRILLPKILAASPLEICVIHKVVEIYEICLHLLNDSNHTVINASLECLCVILNNSKPQLTNFLINDKLIHMDVLCKKRSLKNQIFRRKLSTPSDVSTSKNLFESPKKPPRSKKSKVSLRNSTREDNSESDASNVLDYAAAHSAAHCDDKGLLTGSDIELDSMRLNDFELCQSNESLVQLSEKNSPAFKKTTHETPLRSQKSTDSIGSFLNTLMHPKTDSVSKFFRVGTSGQGSDLQASNIHDDLDDELNQTETNMSEMSDGSMLSLNSSALGTFDVLNKSDDSIPEIEILNEQEIATIRLETDDIDHGKFDEAEQTIDQSSTVNFEAIGRQIPIGSIGNQPLIYYTIRLISSKFLLLGISYKLIDDCEVRISIKNLSLSVIGHCVALCPRTLLLSLQYNGPDNLIFDHNSDSDESDCSISEKTSPSKATKTTAEPSDELIIKDDHFGENSKVPNTYFDFFFPLSKSADNVLLSRLTSANNGGESTKRTQKLNNNLSDLLSKSEILDSKSSYKCLDGTIEPNLSTTDKSLSNQALIQSMTDTSHQFVEDVLLFWNHSDPVLRANVQLLVGNFLFNVLDEGETIAKFIEHLEIASTYRFLNFNVLFHILMKGLSDEIHTVVKQSLVSLEKVLSILLDHRSDWFQNGDICMESTSNTTDLTDIPICITSLIQLLDEMLEKFPLVFENKYWVIQNKYCHFIATINYNGLEKIFGRDKAQVYKNRFVSHIYAMLRDGDARIRNEAAIAMNEFNTAQLTHINNGFNLIAEFSAEILSNEVPYALDNPTEPLQGFQLGLNYTENDNRQMKRILGKFLFDLSNMLFDLKSSEQLLGAIKCLLHTMNTFNPIQFIEIWYEYNILDMCVELLTSNYSTGTDLSCQIDLLTISINLLAASVLRKTSDPYHQKKTVTTVLIGHVMKLLSIYHNVLNNKRPVFIPKGQKVDIFVNSRELQQINSHGYFGNDYFYLKIYKILRIIYENYKITINEEIGSKLFSLLKVCLKTMALLLEMMEPFSSTESTIFFDEILIYIRTFLIYEPKMAVVCIKQLIRNMFLMTFPNWKINGNLFDFQRIHKIQPTKLFEYLDEIRCQSPVIQKKNVNTTPVHTGSKLINFLASTSTPEKHKINQDHRNIKLFEPIVIQCLKLFTKSDAEMQSYILDMLCQVLQLKVNYCLLDANNIFMDFTLKLIESIEIGMIRNSQILTPKVIKFVFYLAKQKEKPQMSIPKIINITDNLLANSITNNGSVEALYQLAFEIYFPRNIENDSDEPQQTIKELNTQKEVVFSMLLKFIEYSKVKRMICMILTKETNNSKEIHVELAECLLHMLMEQKTLIHNSNDYFMVNEMCSRIRLCLLVKRENTVRLVSRLQKRDNLVFDDMAVKSIILNIISEAPDENAVLECISANQLVESVRKDLSISITYTTLEYNLLFDGELNKIMEFLQMLENYLQAMTKVLVNCPQIGKHFRRDFEENPQFINDLLNFMRNLSTITNTTNICMRSKCCLVKRNVAIKLFTLIFELYDASFFVENMKMLQMHTEHLKTSYDQCILSNLIESIILRPLNDNATEFLLNHYYTKALLINSKFIINAAKNTKFHDFVLGKMSELLKGNTVQKDILYLFLDVIEASGAIANVSSVMHLVETLCIYQDGSALSRRSFTILNDTLAKLNGLQDAQRELVSPLRQFKSKFQYHEMFFLVERSIENIIAENRENVTLSDEVALDIPIDEEWFSRKAMDVIKSQINKQQIFQILCEIKSEQQLSKIFQTTRDNFGVNLLAILIECAFETMIAKFKHDCFQHNPHMNYLKLSPILKQSISILCNRMDEIFMKLDQNHENPDADECAVVNRTAHEMNETIFAVCTFLKCIMQLQHQCMIYVEMSCINRFLSEQIFRQLDFQRLVQFSLACLSFIETIHSRSDSIRFDDLTMACDCLTQIIRVQAAFNESNNFFTTDESHGFFNSLILILYNVVRQHLSSKSFLEKNQLKTILNEQHQTDALETAAQLSYAKAIFLGEFVEHSFINGSDVKQNTNTDGKNHLNSFHETILTLIVATMRSDSFYFFAITPREIINSFDWQHTPSTNQKITFQSVPIDYLNESEIVEKFLKRINIFGFPSRQHFEEFFMSLLLLINKENDANIVDAQEEYQIKTMCILALFELLISCQMYPNVGDRLNSLFHHFPRLDRLKADTISSIKLHGIQNSLMQPPSVFYIPNLERCAIQRMCNIIGSDEFLPHQYDLNVIWHIIEGQPAITRCIDVKLKNMKHFLGASAIDFDSSIQLTFDVICQLLDANCVTILPHIVKFSELCENRDQFHWIKDTMIRLHETIPMENAIAHQTIAYCLCKSYAILIPSVVDVNQLCTILRNYLKSSHLFIRIATLKGLLLLFESCIKSNTTIGSLSEEILLLRTFISDYITRYGIIEESPLAYSNEHTTLVWTLNFYVIECTSKYVSDCEMVTNTIISANNVLKRTTSLALFSCIIHGLERVIISKTITRFFHEKIEKLAIDLVKLENEPFSLLALKLLVTCMYIGSNEQLENTEKCNGIVQDEPEVIMLSTEKIEILFQRIKLATRPAAHIYGNVLCQMTHDLVPPKELLTKVIKEFLTVSQPHCEVIARVLFEVFRSAIDSAYLPMLQDWLLCSLPNFVTFPTQKIMWYLIVIFISASINLNLIKIFPQVLADYNAVFNCVTRDKFDVGKSMSSSSALESCDAQTQQSLQYKHIASECVATRQLFLFKLACKDFYDRLNSEQKRAFRDICSNLKEPEIYDMLKSL